LLPSCCLCFCPQISLSLSHTHAHTHTYYYALAVFTRHCNSTFWIESGISQRDQNYYEFLNEPSTQRKIVSSFVAHWTTHVKPKWTGPPSCEPTFNPFLPLLRWDDDRRPMHAHAPMATTDTLDVLLTRDLTRFHIIDFNPYAPRTDALLFTYDELATLFAASSAPPSSSAMVPTLRVVDSRAHPAAAHNAPQHQHNMVPLEALTLSEGRSVEEFAAAWMDHVRRGAVGSDDDDSEGGEG